MAVACTLACCPPAPSGIVATSGAEILTVGGDVYPTPTSVTAISERIPLNSIVAVAPAPPPPVIYTVGILI